MIAQEVPHKPMIFRRDAQPEAMRLTKGRRRRIEIVQRIDVDPASRYRDDQIGVPEPKFGQRLDPHIPIRQFLADQIGARDPQVNAPRRQVTRNLCGRQHDKLDALDPVHPPGIFAL